MRRTVWYFGIVLACCLIAVPIFSQSLDAQSELRLGIAAYQKYAYKQAATHFERAIAIDPNLVEAHFYLGLSCDAMYRPAEDSDGEENGNWAKCALREYNKVLALNPSHEDALKNQAFLLFNLARWDDSERSYRAAAALDPNDPEPLYMLSVLDLQRSFCLRAEKRDALHLSPTQSLIDRSECNQLRTENLPRVEEGIALLEKVLKLVDDPDAADYMAFLYAERAEIQCGNRAAYLADLVKADQWAARGHKSRSMRKIEPNRLRWAPAPPPLPPVGTSLGSLED